MRTTYQTPRQNSRKKDHKGIGEGHTRNIPAAVVSRTTLTPQKDRVLSLSKKNLDLEKRRNDWLHRHADFGGPKTGARNPGKGWDKIF